MQGKKFISPGAWFSMNYPSDWNEFEDGEGSFLFYNPDVWSGNFRISAFKGKAGYGKEAIRQELKENDSASLVKGRWSVRIAKRCSRKKELTIHPMYGLQALTILLSNARLPYLKVARCKKPKKSLPRWRYVRKDRSIRPS